jgi:CDP-diacylglycerol---serine O-phosphatidyltransferase
MNNKRVILPNLFTVGNLLCGFIAIIKVHEGHFVSASWLIVLAAFLDAFDGKIARFTKTFSSFGVEFDSMADLVSCGVAPAYLAYALYFHTWGTVGVLVSFLFVLAAAFRLARFNVLAEADHKDKFYGMPVPLSAGTLVTWVIFMYDVWGGFRFGPILLTLMLMLPMLMVSRVRYETFPKLTFADSRENNIKVAIMLGMGCLVAVDPGKAMFICAFGTVMFGLTRAIIQHFTEPEDDEVVDVTVTE